MKIIFSLFCQLGLGLCGFTQQRDSINSEKTLREKVLTDIQISLDKKTRSIDSTVTRLDLKVDSIDRSILETNNVREKADKLLERVQALEDKQKALEQNELVVFQANYQSAVVNLLYMEREIKPVVLFKSSKDFFEELGNLTNPTTYPEYNDWYLKFHDYIEKNKNKDASLAVLSNMLQVGETAASTIPLGGPITSLFFFGMDNYIKSLGRKQKDLKEQSEKMFLLVTKLSQFAHDKGNMEQDWELITKELNDLHIRYQAVLGQSLKTMDIPSSEFMERFAQESDADKRYQFLTRIRKKAGDRVAERRTIAPKDWKEDFYYSLLDVQSLKLRFGNITFRLQEYIEKYQDLLKSYSKDPFLSVKIAVLEKKLDELKDIFDNAFSPMDYINSTTRMYKVG